MQEMQEGNKQLDGCQNMTTRANLFDRYNIEIHYDNITPYVRNLTYKMYSAARHMGYNYLDENLFEGHGQQQQINVQARIAPGFESLNITMNFPDVTSHFNKIRVGKWVRPLITVHPEFDVLSRLSGFAQHIDFTRKYYKFIVEYIFKTTSIFV